MEHFLQAASLAMIGTILALVLKKQSKEIAILLTIACCISVLAIAAIFLEPVMDFITQLRLLAGLDGDMVAILMKAAGVGLIAEVAGAICQDAGESTLEKVVRICGNGAILYLTLPLLTAVFETLQMILEGT
ncbi:MAG: SpoIIIAC/SpoIIIAD family protein [Faecousia sp.]